MAATDAPAAVTTSRPNLDLTPANFDRMRDLVRKLHDGCGRQQYVALTQARINLILFLWEVQDRLGNYQDRLSHQDDTTPSAGATKRPCYGSSSTRKPATPMASRKWPWE